MGAIYQQACWAKHIARWADVDGRADGDEMVICDGGVIQISGVVVCMGSNIFIKVDGGQKWGIYFDFG